MSNQAEQEEGRLSALRRYAILDTAPEEDFDRIARLAARLLDAPFACIDFVDRDRVWFKSTIGFDGVPEIPRARSCCDHAIRQDQVMVVTDTAADPRFAASPPVAGPLNLRFYAGATIHSFEGHRLGTLCVMDQQPRPDAAERATDILAELAGFVRDKLELRREMLRSQEAARQAALLARLMHSAGEAKDFAQALRAAAMAICEATGGVLCHVWRMSAGDSSAVFIGGAGQGIFGQEVYFSQLRGLSLNPSNSKVSAALASDKQIWSETAPRLEAVEHPAGNLAHASGARAQLATPFSFGGSRYAFSLGFSATPAQPDSIAALMREVALALQPILRRHLDEDETRLFRRLIETSANAVIVSEPPFAEPGPHIIFVNAAFEAMTGYRFEEVRGRSPRFLYGPETDPAVSQRVRTAIGEGRSVRDEALFYRKDGTSFWNDFRVTPVPDSNGQITHYISVQTDITANRQARLERDALTEDLQTLVAAIPGVLVRQHLRPDGKWTRSFIAPGVETLTGFTVEEAMVHGWLFANITEGAKPAFMEALRAAQAGGQTRTDLRFRRKDGAWLWLRIMLRGHVAANGQNEVIGIWSDVSSEYDQAAEREALTRDLQLVIRTMPGALVRSRKLAEGGWQRRYISPGIEAVTGYSAEEVMEPDWWRASLHPDDFPILAAMVENADVDRQTTVDFRLRHKDGRYIWINRRTTGFRNASGGLELISIWNDVTAEKQMLANLEGVTLDLEKLIATMPGALVRSRQRLDRTWLRYFVSPGLELITGYTSAETLEPDWVRNALHPDDVPALEVWLTSPNAAMATNMDFRLKHKQGHYIWINRRTSHYRNAAGELELVAIWTDVSFERQLLADREALSLDLEKVIEAVPGALIRTRTDQDGGWHRVYAAPGIMEVTGHTPEEVLEPEWFRANLHPADRHLLGRNLLQTFTTDQETTEFRFRHKQGHWVWVRRRLRGHYDSQGEREIISILNDVTQEKLLTDQVAHTAKLAQLGELATSMAHELNQPLTGISLAAENAQRSLARLTEPPLRAQEKLALIVELAKRASDLIDHMRVFGRKDVDKQEPIQLAKALAGVERLLGPRMRAAGIRFKLAIPEDLPLVIGAAMPLEQVLMNLVGNACDAYAGKAGQLPTDRQDISVDIRAERGWVVIEVQDGAGGIPEEALPRVFEPFFTTKPVGKGTGLGLSISYGIIKDMGGTITAENHAGGCLVRILLPAAG